MIPNEKDSNKSLLLILSAKSSKEEKISFVKK